MPCFNLKWGQEDSKLDVESRNTKKKWRKNFMEKKILKFFLIFFLNFP
jgi:hypothetical protein